MENEGFRGKPVLLAGNGKLSYSLAVCLLQAGHKITLFTNDGELALQQINAHFADLKQPPYKKIKQSTLEITSRLSKGDYGLCIAITSESREEKKSTIHQLEKILPANTIIAINTESIPLDAIQEGASHAERIVGANWSEPAHTTLFLELIANDITKQELVAALCRHAKEWWEKDPYVIAGNLGIRSKLLSAITREAFFLVQHGYGTIEDIDRACRNDPGYYLSFAGNFRYMDLMGASGYGEVMKELNPELCKARQVPEFFANLVRQGYFGIEKNKGFYEYNEGDAAKWDETFRTYSFQIQEIIKKYPFGDKENNS